MPQDANAPAPAPAGLAIEGAQKAPAMAPLPPLAPALAPAMGMAPERSEEDQLVVIAGPEPAPAPGLAGAPGPAAVPTTVVQTSLELQGVTPEQFTGQKEAEYNAALAKVRSLVPVKVYIHDMFFCSRRAEGVRSPVWTYCSRGWNSCASCVERVRFLLWWPRC